MKTKKIESPFCIRIDKPLRAALKKESKAAHNGNVSLYIRHLIATHQTRLPIDYEFDLKQVAHDIGWPKVKYMVDYLATNAAEMGKEQQS